MAVFRTHVDMLATVAKNRQNSLSNIHLEIVNVK